MISATFVRRLVLIAVFFLPLSGCGSLPPLKRVVLSPPQTARLAAQPSHWQVRRVRMPAYLDNDHIEMRTHDYVLKRLKDAKWAERLPIAATELLQQTINEKLEAKRDKHYIVHVKVHTFEPQASGHVVLAASWRVSDADGNTVAHDDSLIKKPLPEDKRSADDIGRAMSTALRELAMKIVARAG